MVQYDVVIVGTGHGGAQAGIALRQQGFDGSILMIGRDSELPYERPPLSKEYLAGEKPFERLLMRPADFWHERNITLALGVSVEAVVPEARELRLADGSVCGYRHLIWAAGGEPRKLPCPGGDLPGIYTVRNRADVDRMTDALGNGASRIVIVGGGYIGLEAAAVLTKLGCSVTLVEVQDHVLARVAGPALAGVVEQVHRSNGVDLRTRTVVERITGGADGTLAVELKGGEILPADMVVVGIGIAPSVAPLLRAGAEGVNGVDVDEFCRTNLPDVYAIGDCAAHLNAYAQGRRIRLESVQNANDMAITAARSICGLPSPYNAVPWFWSNQYDLRIQSAGISASYDTEVLRGDPASKCFSVLYLRQGRIIALDCVNQVKDFVQGRKLVEQGARVDAQIVADPSVPLKSVVETPAMPPSDGMAAIP
jgi:3-phenylpropionate/trans-cinnamate dioxygenase ferredoxin reductase subunit